MSALTQASQEIFSSTHPYSSTTTDRIDRCLKTRDLAALQAIVSEFIETPDKFQHLDFVKLAHACHVMVSCETGALVESLKKPGDKKLAHKLASLQIGKIAANVMGYNADPPDELTRKTLPSAAGPFLAICMVAAEDHEDPTVQILAKSCIPTLRKIHSTTMGLIGTDFTPSPTQTPPLSPPA